MTQQTSSDLDLHKPPIASDEWYTPWNQEPFSNILKHIEFQLDPCSPPNPKYRIAQRIYTAADNGLVQPWHGRVWLNPPYSNIHPWLIKAAAHGDCLALLHARQDTQWWAEYVWGLADGVVMLTGRVKFINPARENAGKKGSGSNVGQALIAYGMDMTATLRRLCNGGLIAGQYIPLVRKGGKLTKASKEKIKECGYLSDGSRWEQLDIFED